ncbi:MAG: hypothetical protein ACRDH5_16915, partial [bacterium]
MFRRISIAIVLILVGISCSSDGPGAVSVLPGDPGSTLRSPPRRTPAVGGPMFAIGDSLLFGAEEHGGLDELLHADGWEPEVLAEHGRSTRWAIG